MELAALPHHFNRTFPLFGKLSRFGRVAVVADQAWVRVTTRDGMVIHDSQPDGPASFPVHNGERYAVMVGTDT